MCSNMCILTVLSGHDDDGDQQGGAQQDQADGGEAVRLGNGQWATWSESRTNWEGTMRLVVFSGFLCLMFKS